MCRFPLESFETGEDGVDVARVRVEAERRAEVDA